MATQRQACAHIYVNEHKFRQLVAVGVIEKAAKNGGYDLDVVRHQYIKHLQTAADQEQESSYEADPDRRDARIKDEDTIVKERARLAAEQAEKIALDNRIRKRELLPVGVLEEWAGNVSSVIRSELEAMAAEMKRQLPFLRSEDLAVVRRVVSRASDNIADFEPFN